MKPSQIPPTRLFQAIAMKMPKPTIAQPTKRPSTPAKRVARLRSPVIFHAIARAIRPPSSGKPGIRLKKRTIRLIEVR